MPRFSQLLLFIAMGLLQATACLAADKALALDWNCNLCQIASQPMAAPVTQLDSRPESDEASCRFGELRAPLTVLDAIERALCHSHGIKEAQAQVRAQDAAVGIERASLFPTVSAELSFGQVKETLPLPEMPEQSTLRKKGRNSTLGVNWVLFDFGRRAANIAKAERLLAAADAGKDAKLQATILETAQLFYSALAMRAAVEYREQALAAARDNQQIAEARYQAGVTARIDVLQARTAASNAAVAHARAEGALRNTMGALALALGVKVDTPLSLEKLQTTAPDTEFSRSVEALIAAALEKNPGLAAARAQLDAARYDVESAQADRFPSVSLGANFTRNNQQSAFGTGTPSSSSNIQLAVTIPLFEGNARSHRMQHAVAQKEAKAAQLKAAEEQIALGTWEAYQSVRTETENVKTAQALLSNARFAYEIAHGRYRSGIGTMPDLLAAQVSLSEAEQLQIDSLTQWRTAKLKLAAALGRLDSGTMH